MWGCKGCRCRGQGEDERGGQLHTVTHSDILLQFVSVSQTARACGCEHTLCCGCTNVSIGSAVQSATFLLGLIQRINRKRIAALMRLSLHRPLASLALRLMSTATRAVAGPSAGQHIVDVDVCIVGGGIVGSCVAAALKTSSQTCDLNFTVTSITMLYLSSSSHHCPGATFVSLLSTAPGPLLWTLRVKFAGRQSSSALSLHQAATAECMQYLPPRGSYCKLSVRGSCCQPIASTTTTPCRCVFL